MFFLLFLLDNGRIRIRISDLWIWIRNAAGSGTLCVDFIYTQLLPNSTVIGSNSER
jgi:hypothetical protein